MTNVLLLALFALLVILHRQIHGLRRELRQGFHRISHKEYRIMDELQDVVAIVTEQRTIIAGVVEFIRGLKDEKVSPEARAALIAALTGNNVELEAALVANVEPPVTP